MNFSDRRISSGTLAGGGGTKIAFKDLFNMGSTKLKRALEFPCGLYLAVDLATFLYELDRLRFHAFREGRLLVDANLRRVIADVLRNLHRTKMRAAHRAEMRELRAFLRQCLVVEFARLVGIETKVELV